MPVLSAVKHFVFVFYLLSCSLWLLALLEQQNLWNAAVCKVWGCIDIHLNQQYGTEKSLKLCTIHNLFHSAECLVIKNDFFVENLNTKPTCVFITIIVTYYIKCSMCSFNQTVFSFLLRSLALHCSPAKSIEALNNIGQTYCTTQIFYQL